MPGYRVRFFELLAASLMERGIELTVAAAFPEGSLANRKDSAEAPWIRRVTHRRIRVFGKSLNFGGSFSAWKNADGVILTLQGSSIDSYRAIFRAKWKNQRVGFWGHVKSYVNSPHPVDMAAERWLMHRADHIFAYTQGGSDFALSAGVKSSKITTVMNSVDTTSLEMARAALSDSEVEDFRLSLNLADRKILFYLGGLDKSKKIDLLGNALDLLWTADPSIVLVVGGRGDDERLLDAAVERGQCIMMGHIDDRTKAIIANISTAIVMPGRIGLVAVEALLLGVPIISTKSPFHAPENEYLIEGSSLFSSQGTALDFSTMILDVLSRQSFNHSDHGEWSYPTLEKMVFNYAQGIEEMMATN